MVPLAGGTPNFRKAHFIKPSTDAIKGRFSKLHSLCLSSLPVSFEPQKWVSSVKFQAWKCPLKNWIICVKKMAALHESTWKKAGIFEAIMNSTCEIRRNDELVFGVAEKWCDETKSFIFAWGEASITLEDVMILGGFSVLGSPVYLPLDSERSKEKVKKLEKARRELGSPSETASFASWMKKFISTCCEIEHEAFIAMWLCRYVFPSSSLYGISESVFTIAIHLARGTKIALAPAVLAAIYSDLRSLKSYIVTKTKSRVDRKNKDGSLASTCTNTDLWSPFQLVQVWTWERFLELRPRPNLIQNGEPRLARWHGLNGLIFNCSDFRSYLDSAKGNFDWRPYTKSLANWKVPDFYGSKEMCVSVGSSSCHVLDEMLSFVRCLRVSDLIGLQSVELYLPHRVALQFGMDQDLPGSVAVSNENPDVVWSNYIKPVKDGRLYIPSRFREGDFTARYLEWWKGSLSSLQERRGSEKFDCATKMHHGMIEGEEIWSYVTRTKKVKRARRSYPQPGSSSFKCLKSSPRVTSHEEKDSNGASSSHKLNLNQKKDVDIEAPSKILKVSEQSKQQEEIGAKIVLGSPSESFGGKRKAISSDSHLDVHSNNLVPDFSLKRRENSDPASFKFSSRTLKEMHDDRARKELHESPKPPGFALKSKMQQAKGSLEQDSAIAKKVCYDRARKELDEPHIPPGFAIKRKMQQAKGSLQQDSVIAKEVVSPLSRHDGDFEKPRYPESHSPDSTDEDQMTVSEWFRTRNKIQKTESKEPERHSSASDNENQLVVCKMLRSSNKIDTSQSKDPSSSKNSTTPCQNPFSSTMELPTSSAGKLRSSVQDVTDRSVDHNTASFDEILTMSFNIEARVEKLERQIAKLKAAKSGKAGPS